MEKSQNDFSSTEQFQIYYENLYPKNEEVLSSEEPASNAKKTYNQFGFR